MLTLGDWLGDIDGLILGLIEGEIDTLGLIEGDIDGEIDGLIEGEILGLILGEIDGETVSDHLFRFSHFKGHHKSIIGLGDCCVVQSPVIREESGLRGPFDEIVRGENLDSGRSPDLHAINIHPISIGKRGSEVVAEGEGG